MKTIKAWAIIDKKDGIFAEAQPNWGRYWIFESRAQARNCKKDMLIGNYYKVVRIEIKILKK